MINVLQTIPQILALFVDQPVPIQKQARSQVAPTKPGSGGFTKIQRVDFGSIALPMLSVIEIAGGQGSPRFPVEKVVEVGIQLDL